MKQRLLELDGCRGLLCWTVVAGHWIGSRLGWGNVNFSHSYISVDGFFILSGIVLTYIYREKIALGKKECCKFFLHRIERLYPLHILTFLMTLIIYALIINNFPFKDPTLTAVYNLFLIHGLGFATSWNWNDPSWSISVELYASILAFPFLAKTKNNMALIAIAVISYSLVYGRHHALEAATDTHLLFFSSGLLKCIAGMALGVMILNISNLTKIEKKPKFQIVLLQSVAILFSAYFIFTKDNVSSYDSLVIISFVYIFYSLINYSSFWNFIFSHKALVYFGNISFSIYLLHTPLMLILDQLNSFRTLSITLQSTIFLVFLVSISHVIYNKFELPIYKKLKKKSDSTFS